MKKAFLGWEVGGGVGFVAAPTPAYRDESAGRYAINTSEGCYAPAASSAIMRQICSMIALIPGRIPPGAFTFDAPPGKTRVSGSRSFQTIGVRRGRGPRRK